MVSKVSRRGTAERQTRESPNESGGGEQEKKSQKAVYGNF